MVARGVFIQTLYSVCASLPSACCCLNIVLHAQSKHVERGRAAGSGVSFDLIDGVKVPMAFYFLPIVDINLDTEERCDAQSNGPEQRPRHVAQDAPLGLYLLQVSR